MLWQQIFMAALHIKEFQCVMSIASIKSTDKTAIPVDLLVFYLRQQETVGKDKCIERDDAVKSYTV